MENYNLFFKLSFINYLLVLIARPYITARTWADTIFILFILSCIYQITYIFYFRKKENATFKRCIANYFLYLTYTIDTIVVCVLLNMKLKIGYISAWEGIVLLFIGVPIFIICSLYQIIYYRLNRRKKILMEK